MLLGYTEMLLSDAIPEVAGLEKPASGVHSVTTYEPGKNRLLLSGDLAFYVLRNVFIIGIRRFIKRDERYHNPETTYKNTVMQRGGTGQHGAKRVT